MKKKSYENSWIYDKPFSSVYPHYVDRAVRNGKTKAEIDQVICRLTWYSQKALEKHLKNETDFQTFYGDAPEMHPHRDLITGSVCGVKIAEIDHPLMRNIRYLDKLVDEVCKGRKMEKILRTP